MTPSTSAMACAADSGTLPTGMIWPLIFKLGGTPRVMKRSEAFFSTISLSRVSNSMVRSSIAGPGAAAIR